MSIVSTLLPLEPPCPHGAKMETNNLSLQRPPMMNPLAVLHSTIQALELRSLVPSTPPYNLRHK